MSRPAPTADENPRDFIPRTEQQLLAWTEGYLAGYERGYETRGDEVNAIYPPPRVLVFGRWYDQATERQKADAEVHRQTGRAQ